MQNTIKGIIWGESAIGKTKLLYTLDAPRTFVASIEAGLLSVKDLTLNVIELDNWAHIRALTSIFRGADTSVMPNEPYSAEYVELAKQWLKSINKEINPQDYDTFFVDSITAASRFCMKWCMNQTDKILTQQGKVDIRKVYGLLGQEMVTWLTQLQRIPNNNVWLVGILDKVKNELGGVDYEPQLEGSATGKAITGIFDEVMTMAEIKVRGKDEKITSKRGFVTQKMNPWGYPAKDRSGVLEMVEPAHLGQLMQKIQESKAKPFSLSDFLDDEIIY